MSGVVFMQLDDLYSSWTKPGSGAGEVFLLIGVLAFFSVVFFVWAAYVRRPHRRHHHHHSGDDHGGLPERHRSRSGFGGLFGSKHRHRRRHRRERPVNPTLAQVGGLPPRRDEKEPPR